ncbi:sensor histidine kinase [Vaginisenegalia massiliensis]|uniref:sensor histidine kinase n=1 Tax=Vaginisenegalia massiliensis TaxID=2058294 RepID=UPI000F51DCC8|nr:HAMP domain-containing sensor histidine kinase [Vaginisenegalia massiliensis]
MKKTRQAIIRLFIITVIVLRSVSVLIDSLFEIGLRQYPDWSMPFTVIGILNIGVDIAWLVLVTFYFIKKLDHIIHFEVSQQIQQHNLLFASITHDLKTPLTAIKGYATALKDQKVEENQRQSVYDRLRIKVDTITNRLDQLTAYTKLASQDDLSLTTQEVYLNEVISQVLADHYDTLESYQVQLELDFTHEELKIQASYQNIYRLIENIVLNVCYHNAKGRRLKVSTKRQSAQAQILIADDGQDLKSEDLDYLVQPYVKKDSARSMTNETGSGLGLAICQRIVDQHQGHLRLISLEAPYTKAFVITLPL